MGPRPIRNLADLLDVLAGGTISMGGATLHNLSAVTSGLSSALTLASANGVGGQGVNVPLDLLSVGAGLDVNGGTVTDSFEVIGSITLPAAIDAPTNHTTPSGWVDVIVGGIQHWLPIYQ